MVRGPVSWMVIDPADADPLSYILDEPASVVAVATSGETVTIEVTPDKPGEYDFQCQMGMLHGKLIVEV